MRRGYLSSLFSDEVHHREHCHGRHHHNQMTLGDLLLSPLWFLAAVFAAAGGVIANNLDFTP